MDFLFQHGFLGTRAPLFMDIVFMIVLLLPFFVYGAILLAKKEKYHVHETVQKLLFFISVTVVLFFEYGVRREGGYKSLMEGSSVSQHYILYVLIFHILVSVTTMLLWCYTLYTAMRYKRSKALPGLYSKAHRQDGLRTFVGIVLTMLTGAWVYALLFVF